MNGICQGVSYPKVEGRDHAIRKKVLYQHLSDMVNLAYTLSGLASDPTKVSVTSLTTTRTLIRDRTDEYAVANLLLDLSVYNGRYAAHTGELFNVRTA